MSSRRHKLLARVNWYNQSSLKHITELITDNKYYYRGGRYRQVSLYHPAPYLGTIQWKSTFFVLWYKTKHSLSILGAFAMGTRKSLFTCTILVTETNGQASIFIHTFHGCRTFVLARHEVNIFSMSLGSSCDVIPDETIHGWWRHPISLTTNVTFWWIVVMM